MAPQVTLHIPAHCVPEFRGEVKQTVEYTTDLVHERATKGTNGVVDPEKVDEARAWLAELQGLFDQVATHADGDLEVSASTELLHDLACWCLMGPTDEANALASHNLNCSGDSDLGEIRGLLDQAQYWVAALEEIRKTEEAVA